MKLPLRRVATIEGGGTPTAQEENWGGSIPFVTPPDLRPVVGGLVQSTTRSLTELGAARGSNVVPANSVIVSIRAPIGYVARTDHPVALNQGCRALTGLDETQARYLTYALIAASDELAALGRGTTFQEISAGQLATLEVRNPPLAKQRAIADYLDRETAQIDILIEEQQRLIVLSAERRASLIDSLVLPSGAPLVQLRHLAAAPIEAGVNASGDSSNPAKWPRFVRTTDIKDLFTLHEDRRVTVEPALAESAPLRPGDLIATRAGSVGTTFLYTSDEPACFAGYLVRVRLRRDRVDPYYLALWSESSHFKSQVLSGLVKSTIENFSASKYSALRMPVPPLEEQRRIARLALSRLERIDQLIASAEQSIELSRERRAALIAAAVTGQVDVGVTA